MSIEIDRWTRPRAVALWHAHREAHPEVSDERFAAEVLQVSVGTLYSWRREPDKPLRPSTQQVLSAFLRHQASDRLKERLTAILAAEGDHAATSHPALIVADAVLVGAGTSLKDELSMVADDATSDALRLLDTAHDALPTLHDLVIVAADHYNDQSPQTEFNDLRLLREHAKRLAEQTARPQDRRDLLVITGQATALMASVGFDLGYWVSARKLASVATMYGELAGHPALAAWTLGLQATLAFWDDQPKRALEHIERGLSLAPTGASRFRLRYIASRAHAVTGNRNGIQRVLEEAALDREDAEATVDPLHDEIAGEFRFDDARAAACAAAAWLAAGDGEQAETYAQEVLGRNVELQGHRGRGPVRGSQIDIATARLLQGDHVGAEEYLGDILAIEPDRRTISLAGRLEKAAAALAEHAPNARDLAGRIDGWLAEAHRIGQSSED